MSCVIGSTRPVGCVRMGCAIGGTRSMERVMGSVIGNTRSMGHAMGYVMGVTRSMRREMGCDIGCARGGGLHLQPSVLRAMPQEVKQPIASLWDVP